MKRTRERQLAAMGKGGASGARRSTSATCCWGIDFASFVAKNSVRGPLPDETIAGGTARTFVSERELKSASKRRGSRSLYSPMIFAIIHGSRRARENDDAGRRVIAQAVDRGERVSTCAAVHGGSDNLLERLERLVPLLSFVSDTRRGVPLASAYTRSTSGGEGSSSCGDQGPPRETRTNAADAQRDSRGEGGRGTRGKLFGRRGPAWRGKSVRSKIGRSRAYSTRRSDSATTTTIDEELLGEERVFSI